ncbi:MAG: ATP-binding protein [Spirochaetes bacterium]|nr:ATP-binding protein [Spirochaetota bacterium]
MYGHSAGERFRDEQSLSLVPIKSKEDRLELITTRVVSIPALLPCAAIYGPNASGKTTIVKAIDTMKRIIRESSHESNEESRLPITPFLLNEESPKEPSLFEITVFLDGVRYQYGFKADAERIHSEWLLVYETRRAQRWFNRDEDIEAGKDPYTFSPSFKGQKDVWKRATRKNALFLSTAVQLNCEPLKRLYSWIASELIVMPSGELSHVFSTSRLDEPERRSAILDFLNAADFGIKNLESEKRHVKGWRLKDETGNGKREPVIEEWDQPFPLFVHKCAKGEASFAFEQESQGTKRFFSLAGPLLDILEKGRTLVIDELEGSIHPLLLKRIFELFLSKSRNPRGAQLIATTHSTSLLRWKILGRDEIWFTDKNGDLATTLFPLSDFAARNNEAIEKSYLDGRYGALPVLMDDGLDLESILDMGCS